MTIYTVVIIISRIKLAGDYTDDPLSSPHFFPLALILHKTQILFFI